MTIEQCVSCHGIFLDRGELEQLIGVESSFLGPERNPRTPPDRELEFELSYEKPS